MTDNLRHDRLLTMFREAAGGDAAPPHVADDEELLACWSKGLLSSVEVESLQSHLSQCAECRRRVSELVRNGVLEFPEQDQSTDTATSITMSTRQLETTLYPTRSGRRWFVAIAAVAACLMVALLLWPGKGGFDAQLAMIQSELDAGQDAAAYDHAGNLLTSSDLPEENRGVAEQLYEEAAYRVGRSRLLSSAFDSASSIVKETTDRGVSSGRLANLGLQAQRQLAAELSLNQFGCLLAYGYDLSGYGGGKSLPIFDETTDALLATAEKSTTEFPDETMLRLNRGQLLLSLSDAPGAQTEFETVLAEDDESVPALIGLGLALFEQNQQEQALERFREAGGLDPRSADAVVNEAIALEALGRRPEAAGVWERALDVVNDESLRERIRARQDSLN